MADVVICYASADSAMAGRLAQAVRRQGYTLWSEDAPGGGGPDSASVTDRIANAKATIVIWSEAAAASEWVKAEANFARGQGKLIQGSADDRPPPLPFDPAEMASISNWLGDDSHPGWGRINAGLKRLCEPALATAAPKAALVPRAAPTPAPAASRRKRSRGLVAVLAILLLVAAAAGSFLWMRSQGPISAQQGMTATREPADARPAPPRAPSAAPALLPGTAPGPLPVAGIEDQASAKDPNGAAVERTAPELAPAPVQAAPERRPTGPRINRRNSETMRRFCEGAGRGTPQCRTFRRMLRDQRR